MHRKRPAPAQTVVDPKRTTLAAIGILLSVLLVACPEG